MSLDRPAKDINQGTKGVFVVGSRESVRCGLAAGSCQVDWGVDNAPSGAREPCSFHGVCLAAALAAVSWDLGDAATPLLPQENCRALLEQKVSRGKSLARLQATHF